MKNNVLNYKIKDRSKYKSIYYKINIKKDIIQEKVENKVTKRKIESKELSNKEKIEEKYYLESINALKEYMRKNEKNPNEQQWNKYAIKNKYLSSKTIGYLSEIGFNSFCRKLRKEINKEKKVLFL